MRRCYGEDGAPSADAVVSLWSWLYETNEPRVATTAVTDSNGKFRVNSILPGRYRLTAVHRDADAVFIGAQGGDRLASGTTFSVSDRSDGCFAVINLRRQPVYTIRGRTTAASSPTERRTVRLMLVGGDAFPFESVAEVHADGRYKFTSVPAGSYQFFGGATGAGFLVDRDIEDLDITISWPSKAQGN